MLGAAVIAVQQAQLDELLPLFAYEQLPPPLQARSKPFGELARELVRTTSLNFELLAALRNLLLAKDAAVRAGLAKPLSSEGSHG